MAKIDKEYLQLKMTLENAHPPIWRRVVIPGTYTLADLRRVIQAVFDLTSFGPAENATPKFHRRVKAPTATGLTSEVLTAKYPEDTTTVYSVIHDSRQAQLLLKTPNVKNWRLMITLEDVLSAAAIADRPTPPFVNGGRQAMPKTRGGRDTPYDRKQINQALSAAMAPDAPVAPAALLPKTKPFVRRTPTPEGDIDMAELAPQMDALNALISGQSLTKEQSESLANFLNRHDGGGAAEKPAEAPRVDQQDIDFAVSHLGVRATEDRATAVNTLIQGFADGGFTDAQSKATAAALMKDNKLFLDIDKLPDEDHSLAARGDTATVYAGILVGDMMSTFLTAKQRHTLFQWATDYVRQENHLAITFPGNLTALACGLRFLYAAVMHPDYPPKVLGQLKDTFLIILWHLQDPFLGDEAESMGLILNDLAKAQVMKPAPFMQLVRDVTMEVERRVDPADPRTIFRRKAWMTTMQVLFISLNDDDEAYDKAQNFIFDAVDNYYQTMGIDFLGDDDDGYDGEWEEPDDDDDDDD